MIRNCVVTAALLCATAAIALPAQAKTNEPAVTLTKCTQSYGTIAVVDGDTQGWTKFGLGSPRDLINALATESGCFTPYQQGSGQAATFLMNVIAGDKEEVDKNIEAVRGAAVEGLVRSGAASGLLRSTPFGGSALGMLGGLGGRRKTVAAGIRLISPASGQTMVSGAGEVTKTSITLGGMGGAVSAGAQAAGYASNKDGQMLAEAFIKAFNAVAAQAPSVAPSAQAYAPASTVLPSTQTAIDTKMRGTPGANGTVLRSLRAGTALTRTGKREGLFVEVDDGFGTKGWVSVEDLK